VLTTFVSGKDNRFELGQLVNPHIVALALLNEIKDMNDFDSMISVKTQDPIQRPHDIAPHILVEE